MNTSATIIQMAISLVMIIFGVNQMMNPTAWIKYVPSWMPLDHATFIRLHALCNICLGLLLASGWQIQSVLWIVLLWWLSIIPFAFLQDWTIAVRDSALTLCIVALIYMYK